MKDQAQAHGFEFVPAAIETFGLVCKEYSALLETLADLAVSQRRVKRGVFKSFWKRYLGVSLWRSVFTQVWLGEGKIRAAVARRAGDDVNEVREVIVGMAQLGLLNGGVMPAGVNGVEVPGMGNGAFVGQGLVG